MNNHEACSRERVLMSITSIKYIKRIHKLIINEFSLVDGAADYSEIDRTIQQGATIKGSVAWVLIFSIVIASIGLNVNSIAVIIGAMLISPLMGPIIGIGYSLGIFDYRLLKKSFLNLGLTALLSVLVSAFYFWISPLSGNESEILERTMPTIWDVIIAFCGGLVGIIGSTRKQKSTIIPGVAIATALMPPLCTAGYELTRFDGALFAGALYLFAINCVYIAFSTSIVVWLMKLPRRQFVKSQTEVKVKRRLYLIALLTMLPSIYLAEHLVRDEIFIHNANQFVKREFRFKYTYIVNVKLLPKVRQIEIILIGQPLNQNTIQNIKDHLKNADLEGTSIIIHQADDNQFDSSLFEKNIIHDKFYTNTMRALNKLEKEVIDLRVDLNKLSGQSKNDHKVELDLNNNW